MTLTSIERAIAEIKAGKIVVVVDDEDRENEGDLVCAAELVTADIINFMAVHGRGWICLALTADVAYENLVGVKPVNAAANSDGLRRQRSVGV